MNPRKSIASVRSGPMTRPLDYQQAHTPQPPRRYRPWEWVVVAVGLIIAATFFVALAYFLYQASQI